MAITATKRLQEIVDLLDQKGYVKAKELSQKYQVSMLHYHSKEQSYSIG